MLALTVLAIAYTLGQRDSYIAGEASRAVSPDERGIRDLIQAFAVAVANVDPSRIVDLLCPEEAQDYQDYVLDDPESAPPTPVERVNLDVRNVRIQGIHAVASVVVNEAVGAQDNYFQKIDGRWTVCYSAGQSMDQSATPAPPTG